MTTIPNEQNIQALADTLTQGLGVRFSGSDLVAAIRELVVPANTVKLPESEQAVWDEGMKGVNSQPKTAGARSLARWLRLTEATLSAAQVAALLGRSESTIRHHSSAHRLYAFLHENRLRFPDWQFIEGHIVPGLDKVLPSMSAEVHPEAVTGFFTHPNPDLTIDGDPVSPVHWLAEGRDPRPVAEHLARLGDII